MRELVILFVSTLLFTITFGAPTTCRTCACQSHLKHTNDTELASNGTDTDDLMRELENNRIKRDLGSGQFNTSPPAGSDHVESRPCQRFQIEMLLIPLAIAMIPLALCALFLCTCCCGPKESRGKLPDDLLAAAMSSKRKRLDSEMMELEFKSDYVKRKDSAKTKFSTTVSYIEARRASIWSLRSNTSAKEANENKIATINAEAKAVEEASVPLPNALPIDASTSDVPAADGATTSALSTPVVAPAVARLQKIPSTDSMKRTRFSDTISVISLESVSKR